MVVLGSKRTLCLPLQDSVSTQSSDRAACRCHKSPEPDVSRGRGVEQKYIVGGERTFKCTFHTSVSDSWRGGCGQMLLLSDVCEIPFWLREYLLPLQPSFSAPLRRKETKHREVFLKRKRKLGAAALPPSIPPHTFKAYQLFTLYRSKDGKIMQVRG